MEERPNAWKLFCNVLMFSFSGIGNWAIRKVSEGPVILTVARSGHFRTGSVHSRWELLGTLFIRWQLWLFTGCKDAEVQRQVVLFCLILLERASKRKTFTGKKDGCRWTCPTHFPMEGKSEAGPLRGWCASFLQKKAASVLREVFQAMTKAFILSTA